MHRSETEEVCRHCSSTGRTATRPSIVRSGSGPFMIADYEGEGLGVLASERRDRNAAQRIPKRLMQRGGRPHRVVMDRLPPDGAARRVIGNTQRRERKGRLMSTNADSSRLQFRWRAHVMLCFHSIWTLRKLNSVHGVIHNHFNQEHHLTSRNIYKQSRSVPTAEWGHPHDLMLCLHSPHVPNCRPSRSLLRSPLHIARRNFASETCRSAPSETTHIGPDTGQVWNWYAWPADPSTRLQVAHRRMH